MVSAAAWDAATASQPEIEHLDVPVQPDHHVLRLHVAMDQTGSVRAHQRRADLNDDVDASAIGSGPSPSRWRRVSPSMNSVTGY